MKYIFLSDVHIGENIPENWYQKSVHQVYLKAILQYIQANAQQIQDVVILGDWFDSWMYPPEPQISATVTEIINNNLEVFTVQDDGDFITCMDSIKGDLYYVRGNHDMTIDFNELNNYIKLHSKKNKQVVCLDEAYGVNGIYAEHGHYFDLLCKPDLGDKNLYKPLPIGYFVSRVSALYCQQKLQEAGNQNAAQLPGQGNPDMSSILKAIVSNYSGDYSNFANVIMSTLSNLVKCPDMTKLVFTMPDGTVINAADVAKMYPDILKNQQDLTSLLVVDADNSLDNNGENLCNSSYKGIKNRVVVMGHTHVDRLQSHYTLFNGKTIYVNSGFMCPAIPDISTGMVMTFTEVEQNGSTFTVRLKKVNYPGTSISTLTEATI
ncbi:metallophosphoesterase [Clostridium cellulovorans]|uniref:Calcineurin-like phosphoesterase domain-containing protein n=1 Tax=Clostridium cellulovorans (strain ATCC 35296 / DSM 3052 / OCM 3 / 743B) TaxID=573061 RepID=D9ST94_CLOC7|nr:metallophosphoesterase [Clostridium cellulovorans]ADL50710.1 hypothetical protein Clocel_0942 [Clostridium cellulovorans 743B]